MTDYCIPLNLDFNPLNKHITDYDRIIPYQPIDIKDINVELHDYLALHELTYSSAGIFYKTAFLGNNPHTDRQGGDFVKLNYIYGGKDSTMIWYKTKDTDTPKKDIKSKAGFYIPYQFKEVEKIYEQALSNYNIVQVGIPHNILNTVEPRWCLNILLEHQLDHSLVTMQEIKNILNLK